VSETEALVTKSGQCLPFTPLILSDQPPIAFNTCRPPRPACGV